VALTAPAAGATVSGTVAVTAAATDDVAVAKVEAYVDGTLMGTTTSSPYSVNWNTAGAANGPHNLTAKAYDTSGNTTTSAVVSVTVNNTVAIPALSVDKTVNTHQSAAATTISSSVTTTQANELLVAFISSDGSSSTAQSFKSVTGGGLTWTLRKRTNTRDFC
jgi:hypothetical protein